jgi:rare lipoprotein A
LSENATRSFAGSFPLDRALRASLLVVMALGVANCSKAPGSRHASREIGAFSDPKYGKASPRVVGLDESAPKGGGRYQVGKPYMVAGSRYVPREKPTGYTVTGMSSWYGVAFHGRKTANGEIYDRNSISAAHPTMPLPSYARVTNLANNHSIIVRVNDRGPFHAGRILDVSERTASLLKFRHMGTTRVKVDYLGNASLAGSDDQRLAGSLSSDGPARVPSSGAPTQVAMVGGDFSGTRANPPQRAEAEPSQTPAVEIEEVSRVEAEAPAPRAVSAPLPPHRPLMLATSATAYVPGASPPRSVQASASSAVKATPAALSNMRAIEARPAGKTTSRTAPPALRPSL